MTPPSVTLTREQLYEMIWTDPVRTVATRLGISDRGLAKVCLRMRVPTPGRGYWQRRMVGKVDERKPLPSAEASLREQTVTVSASEPRLSTTPSTSEQPTDAVERGIQVSTTLTGSDPMVERTARAFRHARHDSRGLLTAEGKGVMDLRVTRGTLERALLIADALVRALTDRGYSVSLDTDGRRQTVVEVSGERLTLILEESIRRVERRPQKQSTGSRWSALPALVQYDYIPTGDLRLKITDTTIASTRRTWRDTNTQRLEARLNSFVKGLLVAADAKKTARARMEERQREWEERERMAAESRMRQMEEERRIRLLESDLSARARSLEVLRYVEAVRATAGSRSMEEASRARLEEWLAWAVAYATRLDPAQRGSAPQIRPPWEP